MQIGCHSHRHCHRYRQKHRQRHTRRHRHRHRHIHRYRHRHRHRHLQIQTVTDTDIDIIPSTKRQEEDTTTCRASLERLHERAYAAHALSVLPGKWIVIQRRFRSFCFGGNAHISGSAALQEVELWVSLWCGVRAYVCVCVPARLVLVLVQA